MKRKYLIISTVCLLLSSGIHSQVTIGSGQKPADGALLDLKQEGTTTKGLGMPRVKLSDMAKLKMGTNEILDTDEGGNQYTKHTGLIVYNVSDAPIPKCAPIPDGLYVWDGGKWNGINTPKPVDPVTLTLSGANTYNIASGLDLRPQPTAETFNVTWSPANPLPYTNTAHATFGGVTFSNITASPLATSPAAFSMTPAAMTPNPANPFQTKESTLTFDIAGNECYPAQSQTITLNQTNKALTVSTPLKEYTASATNQTNTLTTNADWKLATIMPNDATNAISNVRVGSPTVALPTNTTQTGYEQNNNAGKAATLTYDIAVAASKARYSMLTFADTENPKRFSDVTITVLQCTNVGLNPTIEQWALIAGFTQTEINQVKSTGTDSRKLPTGIQMHRVANTPRGTNQIFLSSNFGANPQDDDARWMIHNLDSKAYDGVAHSASRTLSGPNGNTGDPYNTAYWAYPKPAGAITANDDAAERPTYDNNQRLGLLYTWDAATAGKGGANGQGNVDNPTVLQESGRREGNAVTEQKRRQGICPSGWHLPSDDEWSLLEQNIVNNKSAFSSLATSTGATLTAELNNTAAPLGVNRPAPATAAAATPNQGYRGLLNNANGHGNAMKEICEPATGNSQGASNGINTPDSPGFDALLAGAANGGSAIHFASGGYFWSASSSTATVAWYRAVNNNKGQVHRNATLRNYLFSVRCKK